MSALPPRQQSSHQALPHQVPQHVPQPVDINCDAQAEQPLHHVALLLQHQCIRHRVGIGQDLEATPHPVVLIVVLKVSSMGPKHAPEAWALQKASEDYIPHVLGLAYALCGPQVADMILLVCGRPGGCRTIMEACNPCCMPLPLISAT
jgi:hypothetical protein